LATDVKIGRSEHQRFATEFAENELRGSAADPKNSGPVVRATHHKGDGCGDLFRVWLKKSRYTKTEM
jgi:hypothetical protein